MPSVQALAALLWGKPEWLKYFTDDVGEVRRSFVPLAIEFILVMAVALLVGNETQLGLQGTLLQAVADLAATACFLTIFAVFSLRLGYRTGLCRVIAGLNWASMMLSIIAQAVVFIALMLGSEALMQGVAVMVFIWINVVLFRIVKQGLGAPTGLAMAALALHLFLSLTFTIAAVNVQFGANPAFLTEPA
ncbi:hypothetical protein VZ95_14405 [Elstera litoralis]|uniref:Yip1 domain-containing protein n=1 Tax=Elstera litoralis TaxID=552518 RepID=A0A0F3IQD8_9PROT|nr:hypothetical protein [Elstera litoralis]KJV08965.1 hypothetical protein VZ95_14405 [Elstera litoralis]